MWRTGTIVRNLPQENNLNCGLWKCREFRRDEQMTQNGARRAVDFRENQIDPVVESAKKYEKGIRHGRLRSAFWWVRLSIEQNRVWCSSANSLDTFKCGRYARAAKRRREIRPGRRRRPPAPIGNGPRRFWESVKRVCCPWRARIAKTALSPFWRTGLHDCSTE